MPKTEKSDARPSVRLPAEQKDVIEAAAHLGQSLSGYAVSTLVKDARGVVRQHDVTVLSRHDRDLFVALLDDTNARPNEALKEAARRYKRHFG